MNNNDNEIILMNDMKWKWNESNNNDNVMKWWINNKWWKMIMK